LSSALAALAAPATDPPAFGWPITSPNTYRITAGFDLDPAATDRADWTGWETGDATGGSGHAYDGHGGTDIGVPTGTAVFATASGTVNALREVVPNDDHSDTGNYLILSHSLSGRSWRTMYWHLSQNGVIPTATGVAVTKGAQVASSDNTGNSTGPHLHYQPELEGTSSCPFYHAWWENDEFYYGDQYPCLVYLNVTSDGLNCREGVGTTYNIITSWPVNARTVGVQRNGWWRVFLPLPPAKAYEARTAAGALAAGYSETGTWADSASKTSVADAADDANRTSLFGSGSRFSTFGATGDAGDAATFTFTAPNQRGNYDIYASWPGDANAANVTYRVTDSNGSTDVVLNQTPASTAGAGSGSKADPYRIRTNPYVANHTTVGAPSDWASYSPVGTGINEGGPERLYRFDLTVACSVTIDVTHAGYPGKDVDIQLLSAAANTSCIARDDFTITQSLAAGTYYISIDTYGSASAATPYTLRVEFNGPQPFADAWVKLGTFVYAAGAAGSVQVLESSVTGKVDSTLPAKLAVDAIKLVPRSTHRSGWFSDSLSARINTATTPVPSAVIKTDKTAYRNTQLFSEFVEVPIYSGVGVGTANSTAIVGKAVTGQRFALLARSGDWYQVQLTNGTAATTGWILGDHLVAYKQNLLTSPVTDWALY
jgi:murein DD-endopeptidase MepM/ murein hydrolase activator NlpD